MIRGLLLCLLLASPALAEVSQRAVDRAVQAFRAHDYRGALAQFRALSQQAEGRALQARLQFNIARCYEELGQSRQAIEAFRAFLDLGGEPSLRERARASIDRLETALGGRVSVTCGLSVDTVAVVGRATGRPCPAEFAGLPAGEALVVATAASGVTQRFPVRVVAGETVRLRVDISDIAAPPPERAADTGDLWPWVLVGSGVAVTGAGVGFYLSNQDNLAALRADPGNQSLRDQVDSDRTLALTGYVLGGALITGGVVWLLWPDAQPTAGARPGSPFAWAW